MVIAIVVSLLVIPLDVAALAWQIHNNSNGFFFTETKRIHAEKIVASLSDEIIKNFNKTPQAA